MNIKKYKVIGFLKEDRYGTVYKSHQVDEEVLKLNETFSEWLAEVMKPRYRTIDRKPSDYYRYRVRLSVLLGCIIISNILIFHFL